VLQAQVRFDDWLGTMEGKEPGDPIRLSVLQARTAQLGVARLTEEKLDVEQLTLAITAD
jgi:hypothetical protein